MNTTTATMITIAIASISEYTIAFNRKRIKFESSAHPFITFSPLLMPCMPLAADHKRIKVVIDRIAGEWPYS